MNINTTTLVTSTATSYSTGSIVYTDLPVLAGTNVTLTNDGTNLIINATASSTGYSVQVNESNVTFNPGDPLLQKCNTVSGSFNLHLPPAATMNEFIIVKTDPSSNYVKILPGGSDNIIGMSSYILSIQWQSIRLTSDLNSTWIIS